MRDLQLKFEYSVSSESSIHSGTPNRLNPPVEVKS